MRVLCLAALVCVALPLPARAYPIDGYERTGIRRLEQLRLIVAGELVGPSPVSGGRRGIETVQLNLASPDERQKDLPARDADLQQRLESLFPNRHESYSVAILEISPEHPPAYAAYQETRQFQPGSVGKLAIAAGLFAELARLFPDSVERRLELLRTRQVVAGDWVLGDHHDVPFYDPDTRRSESRPIRPGDSFNLFEWADHMMSPSANSAASTVWKEAMLMRAFGAEYPPTREAEDLFFRDTSKARLQAIAISVVNDPLYEAGIREADWRLGSFFTRVGKQRVPGGGSHATPRGMVTFLYRLEQGRVVDAWSSLEIKRLMYMTAKRIRYASSSAIARSSIYFKSGSLYSCRKEGGGPCGKYMGNVMNYMNSVATVERTDGKTYLVALMSNVLGRNSAVDHQTLAGEIDRILMEWRKAKGGK